MTQDVKKIVRITGIALFFIIIVGYGVGRSYDLVLGVKIKNVNIVDGSKVENNILEVKGNAKNAVKLTMDGREISIDQEGNWNETLALLPGYNLINIKAEDKFGNKDEKNYQLTFQP